MSNDVKLSLLRQASMTSTYYSNVYSVLKELLLTYNFPEMQSVRVRNLIQLFDESPRTVVTLQKAVSDRMELFYADSGTILNRDSLNNVSDDELRLAKLFAMTSVLAPLAFKFMAVYINAYEAYKRDPDSQSLYDNFKPGNVTAEQILSVERNLHKATATINYNGSSNVYGILIEKARTAAFEIIVSTPDQIKQAYFNQLTTFPNNTEMPETLEYCRTKLLSNNLVPVSAMDTDALAWITDKLIDEKLDQSPQSDKMLKPSTIQPYNWNECLPLENAVSLVKFGFSESPFTKNARVYAMDHKRRFIIFAKASETTFFAMVSESATPDLETIPETAKTEIGFDQSTKEQAALIKTLIVNL